MCGRAETVEKWSAQYERQRQGGGTYLCDTCQQRVQRESLQQARRPKPL